MAAAWVGKKPVLQPEKQKSRLASCSTPCVNTSAGAPTDGMHGHMRDCARAAYQRSTSPHNYMLRACVQLEAPAHSAAALAQIAARRAQHVFPGKKPAPHRGIENAPPAHLVQRPPREQLRRCP